MNIQPYSRKAPLLSSPSARDLVSKLQRLSRKLCGLGYSKQDITPIILSTFLDLPYSIDWFDLSTTQTYYSLKGRVDFKAEDSEFIIPISQYLLALPGETEELMERLVEKLEFNCGLLGFHLDTDSSGSSEDSSNFLQIYKSKLNKKYKREVRLTPGKRGVGSVERVGVQKRVPKQEQRMRRKKRKEYEAMTEAEVEKKIKPTRGEWRVESKEEVEESEQKCKQLVRKLELEDNKGKKA